MIRATHLPTSPKLADGLLDRVREQLAKTADSPTPSRVAAALAREGIVLGDSALLELVVALRSQMVGAGSLEPLLADPLVTDVLVNGPKSVWVDRGEGPEPTQIVLGDEAAVRRLAQRLAASAGRRLDDATPYVDARLGDGTRLHAVLPPISPRGTCISLRVPRRRAFSMEALVALGSLPSAGTQWLVRLIESRAAFLISGGTGTGKTTLLSALLSLADRRERLLLVEDSSELEPDHPHVVRLEARPANIEGTGTVTLRDLVRQALRMRPDRVVVGEVRGAEVVDLLAALNTGHEGGCGTVHANSAVDVPARLEALALAAGLGREALHAQVAAGLDAVIHIERDRDGLRAVAGVHSLQRDPGGLVHAVAAVTFSARGVSFGPGHAALSRRIGL